MTPSGQSPDTASVFADDVVEQWYGEIGAFSPVGQSATRHVYRAGREGAAQYLPAALTVSGPEGVESFAEIVFWRPLSLICAFAALRTPCTMVGKGPPDTTGRESYVIVGTQSMPTTGLITQGRRSTSYRGEDFLAVLNTSRRFTHTSFDISDPVGVWIPSALLAEDAGEDVPPIIETPLARSAAAFVRNFAHEVAVRGAETDAEAELAAIDVVRSALRSVRTETAQIGNNVTSTQEAAVALIEQNYRDPEFTVDSIVRSMHVSRRHLYRMFTGVGESPAALIARRRLERARTLLETQGDITIDRVAAASGFTSAAILRNRFRAEFGVTPDLFRRNSCQTAGADG
ncbi:helix-turn-helix domain-containing protein [Gordonia terrae]|uniref:AraC family transcriptional regulator n=2 Tax=Gordonia terrae TaxID=2055 RepID=A0AAD0KCK8_9ACTN|nr:AraC family transcriptional regulator [Gordonia terrae]AWO83471.1 AraC family transcriptional regulator [Gordonia terrae]VTR07185.1 AraC family transcriptional regulator [Clostridioides difficile]VTS41141.1 DNA-binding transcriptional activator FeaR [Gordonia terrae]